MMIVVIAITTMMMVIVIIVVVSLDTSLVTVPRFSLETCGKRSFLVFGPTVWNSLPLSLRKHSVLQLLKRNLRLIFFHIHLC